MWMVGSKSLGKHACVRSYFDILKKLVLKQSLLGLSMSQGIIEEALRITGMQEFIEKKSVLFLLKKALYSIRSF